MTESRRRRARVIWALIRLGWNPPPPTDQQADRIIDDIAALSADRRHGLELGLTAHEERVLGMVAEGMTARQIATALGRSEETVRMHEKRIRRKLGARNNAHAVALRLRQQ